MKAESRERDGQIERHRHRHRETQRRTERSTDKTDSQTESVYTHATNYDSPTTSLPDFAKD